MLPQCVLAWVPVKVRGQDWETEFVLEDGGEDVRGQSVHLVTSVKTGKDMTGDWTQNGWEGNSDVWRGTGDCTIQSAGGSLGVEATGQIGNVCLRHKICGRWLGCEI